MKDYYKILGVSKSASTKEIHESFKNLTKNLDKHDDKYKHYKDAYDVLIDYHLRRVYDEQLEQGVSSLYPRDEFRITTMNSYFDRMTQRFRDHMRQFDDMIDSLPQENEHVYKQTYESKTINRNGEIMKAEKYELNKDGKKKRRYRVTKKDKNGHIITKEIDPKVLNDRKDLPSLDYTNK